MKILTATIITTLLLLFPLCYVSAQQNDSLLKQIERASKEQEQSWKLIDLSGDDGDAIFAGWESKEGRVRIMILWSPTDDPDSIMAGTLADDNSATWVECFTKLMNGWKATKLINLSEDNYLFTNNDNPEMSVAYYRGRACVFVTAPSSTVVERFARLIDRLLPAT